MPTFSALVVPSTGVLLTISRDRAAITYLSKVTRDTVDVPAANIPHYTNTFPLAHIDPQSYPSFRWLPLRRVFEPIDPHMVPADVHALSQLSTARRETISRIMAGLNALRERIGTGLCMQDTIYRYKKDQAESFRDSQWNENLLGELPYIRQYAEFRKISAREAAEDILFAVRLADETLEDSELLRLKYYSAVGTATSRTELDAIIKEFQRELYANALS